jgi:hypothetical protein
MIAFIPPVSGVSTNTLDMIDAIAPFTGAVLVGLFLSSLAGIVIAVLADRWLTQRQERVLTTKVADIDTIRQAA